MKAEPDRVLDGYLIVLAQGGSRDAFDRLARRWTPRLVRYAARTVGRPELARDVVQETWIGAIRGLKQLGDPAQFSAWIYSITRRKCVDAIRGNQRHSRLIRSAQTESGVAPDIGMGNQAENDSADLAAAVSRLNTDQREVVHLFYGEDLSVDEIGTVLALPTGTVKSRLHHARESLKKFLGE